MGSLRTSDKGCRGVDVHVGELEANLSALYCKATMSSVLWWELDWILAFPLNSCVTLGTLLENKNNTAYQLARFLWRTKNSVFPSCSLAFCNEISCQSSRWKSVKGGLVSRWRCWTQSRGQCRVRSFWAIRSLGHKSYFRKIKTDFEMNWKDWVARRLIAVM